MPTMATTIAPHAPIPVKLAAPPVEDLVAVAEPLAVPLAVPLAATTATPKVVPVTTDAVPLAVSVTVVKAPVAALVVVLPLVVVLLHAVHVPVLSPQGPWLGPAQVDQAHPQPDPPHGPLPFHP